MRIINPYKNLTGGQWLRGNLHTHTTLSDGRRPPQAVLDDYASRGYGFFMISDHDRVSEPALLKSLDSRGMVLVPGNEISANGPHMLHVGARQRIEPLANRQQAIDAAVADGGFVIVNHPNWFESFNHCSIEQLLGWQNYLGMEIYNGTIGRLAGSPYALDKWDQLLTLGRRVWGFANDDSHLADEDVELGWNVAYVRRKTPAGVLEALRSGRFYCSTGVEIRKIEVRGDQIRLETRGAGRIVAMREGARRFATADASRIQVTVPPDAKYVRFECWGAGESFAWTQPFFVRP